MTNTINSRPMKNRSFSPWKKRPKKYHETQKTNVLVVPTSKSKYEIVVYTDGACSKGHGGWAASLYFADGTIYLYGNEENTTNNRMELLAAIKALEYLNVACTVYLYSDSQYVVRGINSHLHIWQENAWTTKANTPVQNQDLWQLLWKQMQKHTVIARWVKGHNNNPNNEKVDGLAQYSRTIRN